MFGEFIKRRRIEKEISLRKFCQLTGYDASNWSKVERGLLKPPQADGKLKKIASVLKIEVNSREWEEMKDTARIDAGIIPHDILEDKRVVNSLPMFFRTIRSEKPSSKDLDKLIAAIKIGN
jgi:transcriptional regulator with XRE-family HTH domain